MRVIRDPLEPLALALHESAHAVAEEVLRPGSCILVTINPAKQPTIVSGVYCLPPRPGTIAVCYSFKDQFDDEDWAKNIYAGRWADIKYGVYLPKKLYGDNEDIKLLGFSKGKLAWLSRAARDIVYTQEKAIERIARALCKQKHLTGDEVRALL